MTASTLPIKKLKLSVVVFAKTVEIDLYTTSTSMSDIHIETMDILADMYGCDPEEFQNVEIHIIPESE